MTAFERFCVYANAAILVLVGVAIGWTAALLAVMRWILPQ